MESDLDDTHLCIKCKATIIGLEQYIAHRKSQACQLQANKSTNRKIHEQEPNLNKKCVVGTQSPSPLVPTTRMDLENYESLVFTEASVPSTVATTYASKAEHESSGGKTRRTLHDSYDLANELGADVFFSSLQLQSVESLALHSGGGKGLPTYQRQKSQDNVDEPWIETQQDNEITKKTYEIIYKPLEFVDDMQETSEVSEDEDDYDDVLSPENVQHSPPTVPATHTGGKWQPEHRPRYALRASSDYAQRFSPNWDYQLVEEETLLPETVENTQHPPAGHTKGKWVPGSKVQHLEYKEKVLTTKNPNQNYWCNICCRKLKGKSNYEHHLKTNYHLKRSEPEQQLEKATLDELQLADELLGQVLAVKEEQPSASLASTMVKKRKRRATFIKCELCKHVMLRHNVGKHLISHYHYRRMQNQHISMSLKSLSMILKNIHWIVLQSPFQCRPCRFYANSEEYFLQHWKSADHVQTIVGPGHFWCSYCQFECETNDDMYLHLLGEDHKEVLLAINRSVPVCISKKVNIDCPKCLRSFRYNIELRQHLQHCHMETADQLVDHISSASDAYQSRHKCALCTENFRSKVSLQRHEKFKHNIARYFCSICNLYFETADKAKRHRRTALHRKSRTFTARAKATIRKTRKVRAAENSKEETEETNGRPARALGKQDTDAIKCKDCAEILQGRDELKAHRDLMHPLLTHVCPSCGQSFAVAQALGQHTRKCQPNITEMESAKVNDTNQSARETKVEAKKTWDCKECDYSSIYESELIYHRLFHFYGTLTKEQLIECPLCAKSFRKHSLRCHLRQHTNEKIFECEFCGLKFARRHNLKEHTRNLHAENKATTAYDREKEQALGAGEGAACSKDHNNYSCKTCGRTFRTK